MQPEPKGPQNAPLLVGLRHWFSSRRTLLRRLRYAEDGMNGQRMAAAKLREENEELRTLLMQQWLNQTAGR